MKPIFFRNSLRSFYAAVGVGDGRWHGQGPTLHTEGHIVAVLGDEPALLAADHSKAT